MKSYLKFLISTLVVSIVVFEVIVLGILKCPSRVFYSSYPSLIQDKYRILMETNEPKIIIVSGSSSAFGLNQGMLEDATGYKVANLGLHAGFGHLFHSELAKANINEGDIVLLGYEYEWQSNFDDWDHNLIMTGIDDEIEIYTKIPIEKWPKFIGYLFKYAEIKNSYAGASGIYSRGSFDSQTGQMTVERNCDMEYSVETHGSVSVDGSYIDEKVVAYLLDFKQYVENRGASVYFIAPPVVKDAVTCDLSEFDKLKELEEEKIAIPYISNPTDYIFPCELMFDTVYHCNSAGADVRTELLVNDLKRANIIE